MVPFRKSSVVMKKVLRFLRDESGPTAVEYAVMLSLIIVLCLSGIQAIGVNASSSFESSTQELQDHFGQAGLPSF